MTFRPPTYGPIWLASRSERRRSMLGAAGVDLRQDVEGIDDGPLRKGGVTPRDWVMSLAYLKGRWVADHLRGHDEAARGTVLAADTVCVLGDEVLGQPRDAAHARAMLLALRDREHETMTGVCLISLDDASRWLLADSARVTYGYVDDEEIEAYVASGAWEGKAGAYNLDDRIEAGWPIACAGDPTTVMGLPMRRLEPWLEQVRRGER